MIETEFKHPEITSALDPVDGQKVRPERFRHYPALDGLRGVAVAMVMLHHFFHDYPSRGAFHALMLKATWSLWTGVDLFFVLSGFLITGILIDARGAGLWPAQRSKHYFRSFYGRRVLRIFPLYYTVLIVAFVVLPALGVGLAASGTSGAWYFATFTTNIRVATTAHWISDPLDVFWSLSVEEQFYLIWPLVIFLLRPQYLKPLIIGGLIAEPLIRYAFAKGLIIHPGVDELFLYTMLPTHADGLLVGALLATIAKTRIALRSPARWASILLLAAVALFLVLGSFNLLGITISPSDWTLREAILYYSVLAGVFGAVLYLCISGSNPAERIFLARPLLWLGKYSYALYLIHRLVAFLVTRIAHASGIQTSLDSSPAFVSDIFYLGAFCASSLGVAWLSWRMIEQPFLRMKRYLPYR